MLGGIAPVAARLGVPAIMVVPAVCRVGAAGCFQIDSFSLRCADPSGATFHSSEVLR